MADPFSMKALVSQSLSAENAADYWRGKRQRAAGSISPVQYIYP